ncbi:alpha/beta hydrolase [Caulobacter sp. X]|nr:alpha/beta hydrolase [Caulobacter sp. X]
MAKILFAPADGPPLGAANANDLLGEAWGVEADLVVVPIERLADGFLDLSTRIAGEVIQKFTNYRMRLAFIGDISAYTETSRSLRDFVFESNKGRQVWFLNDRAALDARLAAEG